VSKTSFIHFTQWPSKIGTNFDAYFEK